MNRHISIRITDIYLNFFVIYAIQSMAFPNSSLAGIIRITTLTVGILALIAQFRFNLDRQSVLILICGFVLIVSSYISAKTNDMSGSLATTNGRLTSIIAITIHTMLFTVLRGLNLNTKKVRNILYILTIGMLVSSLMSYSLFDIYSAVLQGKRLGSDVSAINLFGMGTAMMAIFIFYSIQNSKKRIALKAVGFILLSSLVASSGSRTALLGLFIGILIYVLLTNNNNKILTIGKIAIGLFMVLYVMSLFDFTSSILDRISTVWDRSDSAVAHSDDSRMSLIIYGFEQWLKKPLFGYGFNGFTLYSHNAVSYTSYSHNNYIELLFNNGLIGGVSYYLPKIIVFFSLARAVRNGIISDNMNKLLITEMVVLLLFDLTIVSYYYISLQFIWILGIGYVCRLKNEERNMMAHEN